MNNAVETILGTANREELWEEMKSRFDSIILISEQEVDGEKGNDKLSNILVWKGSDVTAIGLCEYGAVMLKAGFLHDRD